MAAESRPEREQCASLIAISTVMMERVKDSKLMVQTAMVVPAAYQQSLLTWPSYRPSLVKAGMQLYPPTTLHGLH